jgi:hypothetical protein
MEKFKFLVVVLSVYLPMGTAFAQLGLSAQRCDLAKAGAIEKCVPMQLGAVGMSTCNEAVAQANAACRRKDLTIVTILEEAGRDLSKGRSRVEQFPRSQDVGQSGSCLQGQPLLGKIDANTEICGGHLKVQLGAFKDFSNATNFVKKMGSQGLQATLDPGIEGQMNKVFLSINGKFGFSEESVKKITPRLDQEGIKYVVVR